MAIEKFFTLRRIRLENSASHAPTLMRHKMVANPEKSIVLAMYVKAQDMVLDYRGIVSFKGKFLGLQPVAVFPRVRLDSNGERMVLEIVEDEGGDKGKGEGKGGIRGWLRRLFWSSSFKEALGDTQRVELKDVNSAVVFNNARGLASGMRTSAVSRFAERIKESESVRSIGKTYRELGPRLRPERVR